MGSEVITDLPLTSDRFTAHPILQTERLKMTNPDTENGGGNEGEWERDPAEIDEDLEDASVSIGLEATGAPGSGYHMSNDPNQPLQRRVAIERRGIIEVRCRSCEIVHGILSPEADEYASLLVYQVDLDSTKRSRRIQSAEIKFEFRSSTPSGQAPRVHSLGPDGRFSVLPTTQDETVTRSAEVSVDASGLSVVTTGTSAKWEKIVSRTTHDEARVTGSTISDDFGREIGARWVLHENESIKSGVPSLLRCAMLLARAEDGPFQCNVTITMKADWKSELGMRFVGQTVDDPVLFDPKLKPTNRLRKEGYDTDNLESVDLSDFVDIHFQTVFKPKE